MISVPFFHGGGGGGGGGAQSKVRAYTMLVPKGENVTLFSDFSLENFYPFL